MANDFKLKIPRSRNQWLLGLESNLRLTQSQHYLACVWSFAVTTLFLTAHVVASGKRRWVDCHWQRGNSYLRIGELGEGVLHRGWKLFRCFSLMGTLKKDPAVASYKQVQQFEREFTVRSYCFTT